MMRSGKRADPGWQDGGDQDLIADDDVEGMEPDVGVESADMGIDLDPLDNSKLRRVSRSPRRQWGGIHMLRTGKRSGQGAGGGNSWGIDFMRTLRSRAGLSRRGGRRSWFGGGHMMRSGKRSSWGPGGPTGDDNAGEDRDLPEMHDCGLID